MKRFALVLLFVATALHAQNVRILTIHAASLENNAFGDPADQKLAVYLPPGYDVGDKRYPVVFLLHGIADSYDTWTDDFKVPQLLDRLIAAKTIEPMIVVMPNARNRFLGSYYLNSPITGRWEDYVADELVALVDRTFRTIAKPGARGVAGHSMGGFGAINFGMKRPDVFSAVYALSPCCLDAVEDIGYGNGDAWRGFLAFHSYADADAALEKGHFYPVALLALLSAFSPNAAAPLHVDVPIQEKRRELIPLEPQYTAFRDRFPIREVPRYRDNLRKLRALHIDYGFGDQFAHIPVATPAFSRVLTENGVPHSLDVYDGDHRQRVLYRLETVVFPMFSAVLDKK